MRRRHLFNIIICNAFILPVIFMNNNCSGFSSSEDVGEGSNSSSSISPTTTVAGNVPKITSNFDTTEWYRTGQPIPPSAAPDVVGAFRFICNASHNLYDDPIVHFGKPGASHLHTFFGNTKANAFSTYESLRKTGEGTCEGGPLNRSAYWIPSMMDGKGKVVMPDHLVVYYKALPGTQALPRGLRMVFGFDMNDPNPPEWSVYEPFYWNCKGAGSNPGKYPDLPTLLANCPTNEKIAGILHAPPCWDGVNLDSPDHRSHLSGKIRNAQTNWESVCPPTHPVEIPTFTLAAWFSHKGLADLQDWELASDHMRPELPAGATLHSDWYGAWDDDILQKWTDHAIGELLNCSAGELGNGEQMIRHPGFTFTLPEEERLVDPPPMPMGHGHSHMGH